MSNDDEFGNQFSQMDRDGDGLVTFDEFENFLKLSILGVGNETSLRASSFVQRIGDSAKAGKT